MHGDIEQAGGKCPTVDYDIARALVIGTTIVSMRRGVITGGPGAGKTTLLNELAAMGYPVVAESARAIIAERLASGKSPRPKPLIFAREILRRDIEKYTAQRSTPTWVIFDRGAIEAIGMLNEVSPLAPSELEAGIGNLNALFFSQRPPGKALEHPLIRSLGPAAACK